jgi:hypothetical protein
MRRFHDTPYRHFVGLDLGQATDFTALAVLQRPRVYPRASIDKRRPPYALLHLRRYPPATPYPDITAEVRGLLNTEPLPGAVLVVDRTGVGQSVLRMLWDGLQNQVTCTFYPVTLSAGHEETITQGGGHFVPKKELVGALQALLQAQRLRIPRALPDTALLIREMENFKAKVSLAQAEESGAWREGAHDDLVLAVALAAWMGEKGLPPLYDPPAFPRIAGYYV